MKLPQRLRAAVDFVARFRSVTLVQRCRHLVAIPLSLLALGGCGGSEAPTNELPSGLTPAEAVHMLTSSPRNFPAAMAVRVSTTRIEVQVRGMNKVGGMALLGNEAFPMGSITKSMTATLAGLLVQEGRIRWDSRIIDVLPDLASISRSEYAGVTLTDLLTHRGGLFPATTPEQIALLPVLQGSPTEQRAQLAAWMLQRASTSAPRIRTQYSNGDYIVAGLMLEQAAGQAFESAMQSRVFAPLGATVRFGSPGAMTGEPWGHAARPDGTWQAIDPASPDASFPSVGNPAGGAKLSASAFARYLQMHLRAYRGLTSEILAPATARTIHEVTRDGFARGWEQGRDLEGRDLHWHNGSDESSYYGLVAMSLVADVASGVVITGYSAKSEAECSEATVRLLR